MAYEHMPYGPEDRRGGRRGLRLRTFWYYCLGVGAVLFGVLTLLSAGIALAVVPGIVADERDYQAARPCGEHVTEDCVRSVRATVLGTKIEEKYKGSRYELQLDGPDPVPRVVSMWGAEPLLRHLNAGDEVTVTLWRDYAIAVSKDGVTQRPKDVPDGRGTFITAASLVGVALGIFAVRAGAHMVAHAPGHAATGIPAGLVRQGKRAVAVAGCAVPAGLFGIWTGPVGVAGLWLALAGLLLVVFRRRDNRDRHAGWASHWIPGR